MTIENSIEFVFNFSTAESLDGCIRFSLSLSMGPFSFISGFLSFSATYTTTPTCSANFLFFLSDNVMRLLYSSIHRYMQTYRLRLFQCKFLCVQSFFFGNFTRPFRLCLAPRLHLLYLGLLLGSFYFIQFFLSFPCFLCIQCSTLKAFTHSILAEKISTSYTSYQLLYTLVPIAIGKWWLSV